MRVEDQVCFVFFFSFFYKFVVTKILKIYSYEQYSI